MKKNIFVITTIVTLIIVGCAQKRIETAVDSSIGSTSSVPSGTDGTEIYQNVDPYGSGNGQYGNGQYGDGQYGASEEPYGDGGGLQKIYFGLDQYNITPDQLGVVAQDARILKRAIATGAKVKIEGHCDARGTDEYNYALGLRRAKAAKDALQSNGVNPNKLILVSMGESSPECTTSTTEECYAKNRRVEFKVIQ